MNAPLCQRLDEYLLRDLDGGAQRDFEEHLHDCDACRWEIEEQQKIDQLLKTAAEAIPIPNAATIPTQSLPTARGQSAHSRRSSWVSLGAAVAAVVLIGLTILGQSSPHHPRDRNIAAEKTPSRPKSEIHPEAGSDVQTQLPDWNKRVKVEVPDDVLSLPIETGEPDITLIQLFPVSSLNREP